jgi:hypothetical protein
VLVKAQSNTLVILSEGKPVSVAWAQDEPDPQSKDLGGSPTDTQGI